MISARLRSYRSAGRLRLFFITCLCLTLLAFSRLALSVEDFVVSGVSDGGHEAWLVTFGPGQVYWERFGHNAIWLREPAAGLDHTFNFGFFDFEQEDFFLRFMRGRMLYFSVAQPAVREFGFYREDNRSIRAQKLELTDAQYGQLRDYLVHHIQPENRDYRYDYFLNNCSTRIRDALDIALDGALSLRSSELPAELNFRDQTRRLTESQFWYYLGLELGLGYPVDRGITRWDEMFIPSVVADELADMSLAMEANGKPLVVEDRMLFTSTLPGPPSSPSSIWQRYFLLGMLVVGLAWLSNKFMPPVWLAGLCSAWVLICSSSGVILASLWLLTDHDATRLNANMLLLNPLFIITLLPIFRRFGPILMATGVLLGLLLLVLPKHQYNLDSLAVLGPVNIAVAWYFFKTRRLSGGSKKV